MHISGLFVYPVKSCRGVSCDGVDIGEHAFRDDRRFMVIRPDGVFLSQREQPGMALIRTGIEGDALRLEAPGQPPHHVDTRGVGKATRVELWETPCEVVDQGDEVATWLSSILGTPARLVAMADGYRRPLHEKLPREHDGRLTFADAAPFLIIGQPSLDDLNVRLEEPVPMDRFRPNIVVAGTDAYAEDGWSRIRIGEVEFVRLMTCGRCVLTTIDQATAERGKEPLRTLAGYRPRTPVGGVAFGSYYAHTSTGRLVVGDPVEVLA